MKDDRDNKTPPLLGPMFIKYCVNFWITKYGYSACQRREILEKACYALVAIFQTVKKGNIFKSIIL